MKIAMVSPTRESERAISGYSVTLTENIKKTETDIEDVSYVAGSPMSFLKMIPKLKKYNIVHIQHEYNLLGYYGLPFFLVYLILGFNKNNKIITTMHNILSKKEKFKENKLKIFLRRVLYLSQNKLINWASDLIIVHSDFFVPILTKEYNISSRKIIVVPQGIIENVKKIPKDKAKKELKLSWDVYLVIGNLTPDSGADIPLKYADKIGKTVLVVSSPIPVNDRKKQRLKEYLNFLEGFVKKKKSEKYVRFDIKPISDQMPIWWVYFSAADFVLQAYRGGIGSGIFAHAMAAGTPVVSSDIPFFKDIEKRYGCIKTVKNEKDFPRIIKEALKQKNYKKMKGESERYLKERGLSSIAKEYKKIYLSLR